MKSTFLTSVGKLLQHGVSSHLISPPPLSLSLSLWGLWTCPFCTKSNFHCGWWRFEKPKASVIWIISASNCVLSGIVSPSRDICNHRRARQPHFTASIWFIYKKWKSWRLRISHWPRKSRPTKSPSEVSVILLSIAVGVWRTCQTDTGTQTLPHRLPPPCINLEHLTFLRWNSSGLRTHFGALHSDWCPDGSAIQNVTKKAENPVWLQADISAQRNSKRWKLFPLGVRKKPAELSVINVNLYTRENWMFISRFENLNQNHDTFLDFPCTVAHVCLLLQAFLFCRVRCVFICPPLDQKSSCTRNKLVWNTVLACSHK